MSGVGPISADRALEQDESITRKVIDGNFVRCPDIKAAEEMTKVFKAKQKGASL